MHHFSCYDFFSPGSSIFIFKQFLLARVTGSIIFASSSLLCCHWQSVNQQNECDEYATPAAVVYDSKSPKPEATYEICYFPFLSASQIKILLSTSPTVHSSQHFSSPVSEFVFILLLNLCIN